MNYKKIASYPYLYICIYIYGLIEFPSLVQHTLSLPPDSTKRQHVMLGKHSDHFHTLVHRLLQIYSPRSKTVSESKLDEQICQPEGKNVNVVMSGEKICLLIEEF